MANNPALSTYTFQYRVLLRGTVTVEAANQTEAAAFFRSLTKHSLIQNVYFSPTVGPTATITGVTSQPPTQGFPGPYPA